LLVAATVPHNSRKCCIACSQKLTLLKKEIEWLKEVDKFALQNSLNNLETAYKNFFTDLKKTGSPE